MIYITHFSLPPSCGGKEKHRMEHEAGLSLLKEGLLREFGLEMPDISAAVKAGERGKPYLFQYPDIHFNISHSGNVAVCAVGRRALGVDVELVRPVKLPSFRRVLTQGEQQRLERCSGEERDREFFRIWTLKESYAKALGVGLGLDFTSVEFQLWPEGENFWQARAKQIGGTEERESGEEASANEGWRLVQTFHNFGEEEYVISFCGEENIEGNHVIETDGFREYIS